MTTIAWDGKTLAADQCGWVNGLRHRVKKVFSIDSKEHGKLHVAITGSHSYCQQILQWLETGTDMPDWRTMVERDQSDSIAAVLVRPDNKVYMLSNSLITTEVQENVFATGIGHEIAYGALDAGATAVEAVNIVINRSDYAGFGVDALTWE